MQNLSLALGWPIVGDVTSNRPFAARRRGRRFADSSTAELYRKDGHLITFAPTGAGKGVRVIIPNLLHYEGPVIVIDPKGENFAVTARYRSTVLKQRIFVLDPFEVVSQQVLDDLGVERARLNPLDLINFRSDLGPQLTMMAAMFSVDTGLEPFWDQSARQLLTGALGIAFAKAKIKGTSPSFQEFINFLTADDVVYQASIAMEQLSGSMDKAAYKGLSNFVNRADNERSGVLSTALSYLTPFTAEALNKHLDSSTILPKMIADDDDYTIYIVIPPSKLVSHSLLTRLWVGTLLNTIMERGEKPLKRTLFLLDECAQIGRLDALTKAVTLLRGYGLQVWMFFQDMSQLTQNYRDDANTIINNCGVFQAFGVSRTFAAKPIADSIGSFEPLELVQLDRTQQVLSVSNEAPKISRLMNYLEDEMFAGRWDDNPLFVKHVTASERSHGFPGNSLRLHF